MKKRVKWSPKERMDIPDTDAISTLAETEMQDNLKAVVDVHPILGTASSATALTEMCRGCVICPSTAYPADIGFDPDHSQVLVEPGLGLALSGFDSPASGEIMFVATETPVDGCPSIVVPHMWLMARVASVPTATDEDDRIFYKTADGTEETLPTMTRVTKSIDFCTADAESEAGWRAAEMNGYQRVAYLDWNGGGGFLFKLATIFPAGVPGTKFPNGPILRSVAQVLWAFADRLATLHGAVLGVPGQWYHDWIADLATIVATAAGIRSDLTAAQADIITNRNDILINAGAILRLAAQPICIMRREIIVSVPCASALPWDLTEEDLSGMWSVGSPTKLTVPAAQAGVYAVEGYVRFTSNAGSVGIFYAIEVLQNRTGANVAMAGTDVLAGVEYVLPFAGSARLAVGDYLEVFAFTGDRAALDVSEARISMKRTITR